MNQACQIKYAWRLIPRFALFENPGLCGAFPFHIKASAQSFSFPQKHLPIRFECANDVLIVCEDDHR